MSEIIGKFTESFSPQRFEQNEIGRKLQSFFTRFEAEMILRKYSIGTASDGEPAFWLYNRYNELEAVRVKGTTFFGKDGIWNLHTVLSNEPFKRIGFCSTPTDAFWCNMYLRHEAVWISMNLGVVIQFLQGLDAIAILNENCPLTPKIESLFPYCKIQHVTNIGEELQKSGKPAPFIIPPTFKRPADDMLPINFTNEILSNSPLQKLIQNLSLEYK